jgi:NitT/TauT family transport system permease protein
MDKIASLSEKASRNYQNVPQSLYISKLIKVLFVALILGLLYDPVYEAFTLVSSMDNSNLLEIMKLGVYTLGRVTIAVLLGALWTVPVGVWIGLNPRLAKILQPIIQIAASFPANMLFPFVTILFLKYHVNFEWGSIALMMLGTQWYILFNVIAGAMSIPNDLHEAGAVFRLRGWQKWKSLILPSIFPFLITGIITASGGAWNASIVSEIVSWQDEELVATGLGTYISKVTEQGDWGGIIWGIIVMCLFVVIINRLVWRRLYQLAEAKYHVD